MTTDLHALCARMAAELDHYRQLLSDDRRELHPLAVEARAALAQPEPEVVEPSDEDLDLLVIAIQALRPEPSPNSHDLATAAPPRRLLEQDMAHVLGDQKGQTPNTAS